jgi:hypothetical protein
VGRLVVALLALSLCASADSKTETDLRTRLAASEAARVSLLKANADLTKRLSDAKLSASGATSSLIAGQKSQERTHADEQGAVAQQQDESTQTLANTGQSVAAQTEAEKQLIRIETDVKDNLGTTRKLTYLMVIIAILITCFTGAIIYSNRRKIMVIPVGKEITALLAEELTPHGKG